MKRQQKYQKMQGGYTLIGSGAKPDLADAMEKNRGIRETGIYGMLSVYYLQSAEVTALKNAGIQRVLLHNPSTAQASG